METRANKNKKIRKKIKNQKRLIFRKKIRKFFIFIFILIIGIIVYAKFVGTTGLNVKEYSIKDNELPTSFYGFKIVHFTDLHYGSTIFKEELNTLTKKIKELKPDLIIFTGDLTDNKYQFSPKEISNLVAFLNTINATTGKYIIKGNKDYNKTYDQIISQTDFTLLDNDYDLIYYKGNNPILLTGTGSMIKKQANTDKSLEYLKENNLFTISLIHEPDLFDELVNAKINIVFAGHSHLGQVRLPFIGSIYNNRGSEKYKNSYYNIDNTRMYVSGGVGTSLLKFRLFNRPSINLYRLIK